MTKDYIIVKGENYDEALSEGLKRLDLTKDQVRIKVTKEKKGFLFKKSYVELKIEPLNLDIDSINNNKPDLEVNEDTESIDKKSFHLEYRSDGVYLNILNDFKIDINNILEYINKKHIEDYDVNKIQCCLEEKIGTAYKIAPYQEEFLIDSSLEINVSKNNMEVRIVLTEPSGGKVKSTAEIIEDLNKSGIKFGINNSKIEEIIKNQVFDKQIVVAQGKESIAGKDGQVICNFNHNSENKNAIVSDDGKIDYKNLDKIRNVNKGDLLIEIIPPTEGVNGIDVYGNEIEHKKGKEPFIKIGKNVIESEDSLKIYADKDGEVNFIDGKVYVDEVITINGNVDNETGNIKFKGKVNVKGNVKSGFKIEADGNIEIFGVVEGATLISNGSIVIHRGVQGNSQSNIQCVENLITKYLENAKVKCGGDIEADAILHSDIIAAGKVKASGRKALIVGGSIKAGEEISANTIGSSMGTVTEIEVGVNPEEKLSYEDLKIEISNIEKNMDSSKKAIELLNKLSKKQKLDKSKQELLSKSLNTYKVLKVKYDKLSEELQELSVRFREQNNGKIYASRIIHPGVRVVIGNQSKHIYEDISSCVLYVKNCEVVNEPFAK